jgi:two-component system, NarL family, sensor histidine kinase UhpB
VADQLLEFLTGAPDDLFEVGFARALPEPALRRAWGGFLTMLIEFLEMGDEESVQQWAAGQSNETVGRGYTIEEMERAFELFGQITRTALFSRPVERTELLEDLQRVECAIAVLRRARISAEWSRQQQILERLDRRVSASESRFERLVECAPAAIATTDLQGAITYVSSRCRQLYGTENPDELLGRSALELIAEPDRARAAANLEHTMARGVLDNEPYELVRADGSTYPGELSAAVLQDSDGTPAGFVAAVTDVTERRRTEAAIGDYQHRLRQLTTERILVEERERRRIASELHDGIGQALAVVKMTVETECAELPPDSSVAAALGELSPVLADAIRGTRSLTWALASPLLHEMGLSAALEALSEQTEEKHHIEIVYEDLGLSGVHPNADVSTVVFQAVRELLLNVVKHAGARRVVITASAGEETAEVQVEDDGKGFDPAAVNLLSVDEQRFGLFAIHERIELMGGKLSIRSYEGRGTSVSVGFPREPVDCVQR